MTEEEAAIPDPPAPLPPLNLNLTDEQKRAALGMERTEEDQARVELQGYEEEYLRLVTAWQNFDATEYPEDEKPFHRKRLQGYLLVAEANVEQTQARIENLTSPPSVVTPG